MLFVFARFVAFTHELRLRRVEDAGSDHFLLSADEGLRLAGFSCARTLLDKPPVLFRKADQSGYVMLDDRCPHRVFRTEDKPMLEAIQSAMGEGEFWSMKPAILTVDKAAVRARLRLKRLRQD